ncbi:MAG: hypothetical protein ACFFD1_02225 [Candidatus Thorarchaeota archaeon]
MTSREIQIATKLIEAIKSIENLIKESKNGYFYISHLTQLSRLQRDVLTEILEDNGLIKAVHSGSRSPYEIIVSKAVWKSFISEIEHWALTVAGNFNKMVPYDEDLDIIDPFDNSNLESPDQDAISYWSRLFGQTRIAIASKGIIALILSQISPNGLTADKISKNIGLTRRTITDYLKEGYDDKIFAICFPKNNLQSVGYRIEVNARFVLQAWSNINRYITSIPPSLNLNSPEEISITTE